MDKTKNANGMLRRVTANTCVGDFGQYVASFALEFAPGYDFSGLTINDFIFTKTAKHPAAGHESFGVWKTEINGSVLTVFVDPFLYNDNYTGEAVLGGEKISLSKADIGCVKTEVADDFDKLTTDGGLVYRLLLPESDEPLPLVVAFHGSGEQGTDGNRHMTAFRVITMWGEPAFQAKHKCIVLGPQSNNAWSDGELADVRNIIDRLIADKKADPERIYAAGLSAYQSTLRFAVMNRDLLAGVIEMLYWEKYTPDLSVLTELPVWFCIAENDFTGESPYVREAYRYLKDELHNGHVRCTIFTENDMMSFGLYGGLSHCGWIPTLNNPEICEWLFAQRRG